MPDYLTPTPVDPNAEPITVTDPTRPPAEQVTGNVQQITGGNPDLRPQNSEGFNAGIIWMPRWKPLAGLRFNAEYYRIDQFDAIDFPQAQFIVDNEARYPGRVVRDSNGVITQVNSSAINIFSRKTDGLDLSLDYPFSTAYGEFNLHVVHTTILKLLTQYSATEPAYDGLDFPNDGGAARYKSNLALDWTRRNWSLVWSARYFSSYKQVGAPGSPLLLTIPFLNPRPASIPVAQGGNTIPSQLYQNVVIGYDFGSSPRAGALSWVSGVHVQFLVKNVFEEVPPLDVWRGDYGYYMSGYGDPKGRSFSLSLRKAFGRK